MASDKVPIVSHGRGGQGNINADPTKYVDASIVRKGEVGDQGDGAYSAGRGGAGNIGSPHIRPTTPGKAHDVEVVPESLVRRSIDGNFYMGRGGQGNIHLDESHHGKKKEKEKDHHHHDHQSRSASNSPAPPEGLVNRIKHRLLGENGERGKE